MAVQYEGFDSIRPSFFEDFEFVVSAELSCQYLLALIENIPVGVLKWKRYGIPNHHKMKKTRKIVIMPFALSM